MIDFALVFFLIKDFEDWFCCQDTRKQNNSREREGGRRRKMKDKERELTGFYGRVLSMCVESAW